MLLEASRGRACSSKLGLYTCAKCFWTYSGIHYGQELPRGLGVLGTLGHRAPENWVQSV